MPCSSYPPIGPASTTADHSASDTSGSIVDRIQMNISARYATIPANPTRDRSGSARRRCPTVFMVPIPNPNSCGALLAGLAERPGEDLLQRRIGHRDVGLGQPAQDLLQQR